MFGSLLLCGLQLKNGQASAFILHGHFDLAALRGFGLELRSQGQSVDPDGKKKHDRGERKYRLPDQPPPRQKGSRKVVALPGRGCPAHPGFSRLRTVELKGPHQMGLQIKGRRLGWQGIGQQIGGRSILLHRGATLLAPIADMGFQRLPLSGLQRIDRIERDRIFELLVQHRYFVSQQGRNA